MTFRLHDKLAADCHLLGRNNSIQLLLNRNAFYPWFILVPECNETEFYRLAPSQQGEVLALVNQLCGFVEHHFSVDKLNIAAIGNVVSQLHIHVVGRHHADPSWPGVVWGTEQFEEYVPQRVLEIKTLLLQEKICTGE
jgi:diadenosine tetraphosphate (Ap4A) HIT family hydrolase